MKNRIKIEVKIKKKKINLHKYYIRKIKLKVMTILRITLILGILFGIFAIFSSFR